MLAHRTFSEPYAITVDCTKKRVYWLENEIQFGVDHIVSSQYNGLDQKTILSGSFNDHILGVLGDSLYFLNNDLFYVNEMIYLVIFWWTTIHITMTWSLYIALYSLKSE
jgi:hypothetical protein